MTAVACLGWGSLVWDPDNLQVRATWLTDGPLVQIEFLRKSGGERITLVLHESARPVRSLWALMDIEDIDDAAENLRAREKTNPRRIGVWQSGQDAPDLIEDLPSWAQERSVEAVIWTALGPQAPDGAQRVPTFEETIAHLKGLTGKELNDARRYVRNAPRQVDTPFRRRFEVELGWTPANK